LRSLVAPAPLNTREAIGERERWPESLDTYTSALPALDKSAAEVVASLILGTDVSNR
jgi:hypothetical protein